MPTTLLVVWASKLQSPLLLALRLYWGWHFCQTGWGKLHTHGDVTEYFISLHIPLPGLNALDRRRRPSVSAACCSSSAWGRGWSPCR